MHKSGQIEYAEHNIQSCMLRIRCLRLCTKCVQFVRPTCIHALKCTAHTIQLWHDARGQCRPDNRITMCGAGPQMGRNCVYVRHFQACAVPRHGIMTMMRKWNGWTVGSLYINTFEKSSATVTQRTQSLPGSLSRVAGRPHGLSKQTQHYGIYIREGWTDIDPFIYLPYSNKRIYSRQFRFTFFMCPCSTQFGSIERACMLEKGHSQHSGILCIVDTA